jgi:hypothetical protein
MKPKPQSAIEFIQRYPAVTSHIIAESLGYATPKVAAKIGLDGLHDRENWCEWIYSCYNCNARQALKDSISRRHHHEGPMAEYRIAKQLVDDYIENGRSPLFASWF